MQGDTSSEKPVSRNLDQIPAKWFCISCILHVLKITGTLEMVKLPVEYPADAAAIIIQIYGEGSIENRKLDLVEALWNLIGWTAWHEANVAEGDVNYLFTLAENASDADVIATLKRFNDTEKEDKKGKLPFNYQTMRVWAQNLLGRLI